MTSTDNSNSRWGAGLFPVLGILGHETHASESGSIEGRGVGHGGALARDCKVLGWIPSTAETISKHTRNRNPTECILGAGWTPTRN